MMVKCLIVWICYFVAYSKAGTVPWIKPCAALDSACLIKSAEFALPYIVNGIEELGMPPIDPLLVKDTIANTGDLKLKFTNVTIHQLSKCKFESFTRDPVKSTSTVIVNCPTVIKGQYKMSGSILLIEIFGEGDFSIEGGLMRTTINMKTKTFTKDGKKHYKISSFDYVFEPLTKYNLIFENMYNGDKEKIAPIKKIINDAWKELILDIGKPLMTETMTTIANITDKVFKEFSTEELEIV